MKRDTSITRPLMLALTGSLIAFWLVALGLGVQVMREELDEIFDGALQETSERLLSLIVDDIELRRQIDETALASLNKIGRREYLVYQVRDPSGHIILKSDDAPSDPLQTVLDTGFSDTPSYRIFTAVSSDGEFFLQVADRFANRREAVRESAVTMLIPLLALIPASVFAIWVIVGRALKPLEMLRREIATKDGGNMAAVQDAELPKELKSIARSVNLLLGRLRKAFAAEREFTANSAHELRTPIAGALAQTQRLVEELPDGPQKTCARKVEGALFDLGKLAEKLLQLARAEAGIGAIKTEVDLHKILEIIIMDIQRDTTNRSRFEYRRVPGIPLKRRVDADAFGIVIRNLLENAALHGDPRSAIIISVADDGVIRVVNGCKVIAANELANLKQRFYRGHTTASGSGLGLAIADRIITEMGGTLELFSPATGETEGFEARVKL
ncbi:histidine kinase [Rhizobium sp. 58]|nr:histidine kinase [Rhizobium sp. 58]